MSAPPNWMKQAALERNCCQEWLGWSIDRCGEGHSIGSMKLAGINHRHPRPSELNNSATDKAVPNSFVLARSSSLAVWECAMVALPVGERVAEWM